ncbi:cadmium-induced protein AS8 isoform X1 [Rosa rugosa]|uniref:cadmium-induced protein AS8 isoform X1 n=2 Tax=Rosa rugosa TaxID=74645 RepID=UPI002B40F779|nr:cadmium-induced protein AS8 isoform X1 [Rosa rugosa]
MNTKIKTCTLIFMAGDKMIIKGVFRRYERWNPVHPTSGAFWGLGIGIGCGVGWGPGFGPEVIGYVGAGCGVGFSVGFTLLGVGIGLPANWLYTVPYQAVMAARSSALRLGRPPGLVFSKSIAGESWDKIAPCVIGLQREASGRLSSFTQHLVEGVESIDVKSRLSDNSKTVCDGLTAFGERIFHFPKGSKD